VIVAAVVGFFEAFPLLLGVVLFATCYLVGAGLRWVMLFLREPEPRPARRPTRSELLSQHWYETVLPESDECADAVPVGEPR